ncbi:MAG TPA: hypothetical protein VL979_11355 [Solirubrobacteraceae bacterium]|nr:hypothetical protein [Solirubrobacteraceae bacterium]
MRGRFLRGRRRLGHMRGRFLRGSGRFDEGRLVELGAGLGRGLRARRGGGGHLGRAADALAFALEPVALAFGRGAFSPWS